MMPLACLDLDSRLRQRRLGDTESLTKIKINFNSEKFKCKQKIIGFFLHSSTCLGRFLLFAISIVPINKTNIYNRSLNFNFRLGTLDSKLAKIINLFNQS